MKSKQLIHKPKMLTLVALLGILGNLPATGFAAEARTVKAYFSQLLDGDVHLAQVGQKAGLHMTFKSPGDSREAFSAAHADHPGAGNGGIHLSVRLPWR